jgi:choline dehydrogenase-like flavoprotein
VMGDDPRRSVTDSYGRTHDVDNLFLAGPGLFPTVGAVNPTFTATALASRTAAYIVSKWSALSGA